MKMHLLAFVTGFLLDLWLGDPYSFPHPVRLIGRLIGRLDNHYLGGNETLEDESGRDLGREKRDGIKTVLLVCLATIITTAAILFVVYMISPILGVLVEAVMTYQILATKCLKVESMKVYDRLKNGTIEDARYAVSMIVGRDTKELTGEQVSKAAVETVAENTSDGSIAPMLYVAIGGPILGFLYKAINTMDSMIGYKNERYINFGRAAAKLDDGVNYIPSRISALLMIMVCFLSGENYDGKNAFRIWRRDRFNHASPNSAQTEATCAGALGIQLAGDASYFGKIVKKPFIGDPLRPIQIEDIKRANHLLYGAAWLCALSCSFLMIILVIICR